MTKETGLKYYTTKPYIQIERDNNNNIVKSTVIYLPDLSEPVYLIVKDGPGSGKMDLKLTDGTISTLGIATDPKIADTIESLAALLSKTTGSIADLSSLKSLPQASASATTTELYEVLMTTKGTTMRKIEFN
jgi:hypothetical protein